jgi:hypothetical protein
MPPFYGGEVPLGGTAVGFLEYKIALLKYDLTFYMGVWETRPNAGVWYDDPDEWWESMLEVRMLEARIRIARMCIRALEA